MTPAPALQPLELWLMPGAGPLLPQLRQALAAASCAQAGPSAQPLRWAITGVDPHRGLRLEGVLVVATEPAPAEPTPAAPAYGAIP